MIDDLREYNLNNIQCDICIIGAGAAGIAIANEFNNSKLFLKSKTYFSFCIVFSEKKV